MVLVLSLVLGVTFLAWGQEEITLLLNSHFVKTHDRRVGSFSRGESKARFYH